MNTPAPNPAATVSAPWLEIILPLWKPAEGAGRWVASLLAQTARGFTVRLVPSPFDQARLAAALAAEELTKWGIPAFTSPAPANLTPLELYNWAHDQGRAEWLKPLLWGDELHPEYVHRLAEATAAPSAQVVWCGFQAGAAAITKPGKAGPSAAGRWAPAALLSALTPGARWLGGPANLAYRRTAWRALGGISPAFPAEGVRLLAAELGLHFGLELLPELLATHALPRAENAAGRACAPAESRLVRRSLQNWCRTAKLAWPPAGVAWSAGAELPNRLG